MKSIIDILDLSVEELYDLMDTALDMINNPEKYAHICEGKKLVTLFYEPSTRTRMSFEAAMYDLGGKVLSMQNAASSSAAKGESVSDTAKVMACYADIIAIRHFKEGAALTAARAADIPVINAGDGGHCHPTQTLADLLTIYREKGSLDNLTIGMCGDLKYGRTVHSLINAMARYNNTKFILISPEELKIPEYVIKDTIEKKGLSYEETVSLEQALPKLDILYMTRIQRERFNNPDTYEKLKDSYVLTPELMRLAPASCRILHPLPRVNEISVKVDEDERASYFRQCSNGKFMRMALILKLLRDAKESPEKITPYSDMALSTEELPNPGMICANPRCITSIEQESVHLIKRDLKGIYRCIYCEAPVSLSDNI